MGTVPALRVANIYGALLDLARADSLIFKVLSITKIYFGCITNMSYANQKDIVCILTFTCCCFLLLRLYLT